MRPRRSVHTYLHVYDIIACDQCACDPSHTACRKRCVKVMVDDGSYYFYLLLQFSSATMITQPLPISMLHHHVVYKSLHVVYFVTHGMIYM